MVSSLRLSLMLLCLLWIVPSYGDPVLSCYHFTIDDGLAYQVVRDFCPNSGWGNVVSHLGWWNFPL